MKLVKKPKIKNSNTYLFIFEKTDNMNYNNNIFLILYYLLKYLLIIRTVYLVTKLHNQSVKFKTCWKIRVYY